MHAKKFVTSTQEQTHTLACSIVQQMMARFRNIYGCKKSRFELKRGKKAQCVSNCCKDLFERKKYFGVRCTLKQRQSFTARRAAPMTKPDLIFPAFSSRFVDFAVQFCFRCKFSFHKKRRSSRVRFDSGVIFLYQSQFFATHSNQ